MLRWEASLLFIKLFNRSSSILILFFSFFVDNEKSSRFLINSWHYPTCNLPIRATLPQIVRTFAHSVNEGDGGMTDRREWSVCLCAHKEGEREWMFYCRAHVRARMERRKSENFGGDCLIAFVSFANKQPKKCDPSPFSPLVGIVCLWEREGERDAIDGSNHRRVLSGKKEKNAWALCSPSSLLLFLLFLSVPFPFFDFL